MIKTILVDDDFLVLQALETILSVQDHIEVVGQVRTEMMLWNCITLINRT